MVPLHIELAQPTTPRWLKWIYGSFAVIYLIVETFRLGRYWTFF
jgi:hypothetical protein